jgi:hypothetical protein
MNRERDFKKRYSLVDLFDGLVWMLKFTWKTAVLGGLLVLVLPVILVGLSFAGYMNRVAEVVGTDPDTFLEVLPLVIPPGLILSSLLLALGSISVSLAVLHKLRAAVHKEELSVMGAFRVGLRESLLPVIGQGIVKGIIVTLVAAIPTAVISFIWIGAVQLEGSGIPPEAPLITAVVVIASAVLLIWLVVRLSFSAQAIVFDRAGVVGSLKQSWRLVGGNWWRVFGITLLFGIILSFAAGLITTPVTGAGALPFFSRLMQADFGAEMSDEQVLELFSPGVGLAVAIGLGTLVQQLIVFLVQPVFFGLLYVDLKVRAGDYAVDEPPAGEPPAGESPAGQPPAGEPPAGE